MVASTVRLPATPIRDILYNRGMCVRPVEPIQDIGAEALISVRVFSHSFFLKCTLDRFDCQNMLNTTSKNSKRWCHLYSHLCRKIQGRKLTLFWSFVCIWFFLFVRILMLSIFDPTHVLNCHQVKKTILGSQGSSKGCSGSKKGNNSSRKCGAPHVGHYPSGPHHGDASFTNIPSHPAKAASGQRRRQTRTIFPKGGLRSALCNTSFGCFNFVKSIIKSFKAK